MDKKLYDDFMVKTGNKMRYFWKYYQGDKGVIPIYKRKAFDNIKQKTHTNIHIDYFGDIVGIKQGYIGENIEVSHPEESVMTLYDTILDMKITNSQTIEYSSVEGTSYRLCYTEDGEFKQKNVHGYEVLFKDGLAYYFYEYDGEIYCNVYDDTMIYVYRLSKEEFIQINEMPHNFNSIPIVEFKNNSNSFSNCDASVELMDQYDCVISDSIGEIKDLRRALLKIKGDVFTEEDRDGNPIPITQTISESSVLVFAPDTDGKSSGDASYINNNLGDEAISSTLNRLRGLIYETSGSIDLKELSTAERVFSIKASLLRMDNDANTTETFFKHGLMEVLKLWADLMNETQGVNIDPSLFEITLGRKIPADDALQADIFIKLASLLSIEDALRIAGFGDAVELAERANEVGMPALYE